MTSDSSALDCDSRSDDYTLAGVRSRAPQLSWSAGLRTCALRFFLSSLAPDCVLTPGKASVYNDPVGVREQ